MSRPVSAWNVRAFLGIADVVDRALASVDGSPAADLAELVEADAEARRAAEAILEPVA